MVAATAKFQREGHVVGSQMTDRASKNIDLCSNSQPTRERFPLMPLYWNLYIKLSGKIVSNALDKSRKTALVSQLGIFSNSL